MRIKIALLGLLLMVGGCAMTPEQQAFWREYSRQSHERSMARQAELERERQELLGPGSRFNPIHVRIDPY